MQKSTQTDADVTILDLEDSVSPCRRDLARVMAGDYLSAQSERRDCSLWVRVNALQTSDCLEDLRSIMAMRPSGIVLPKCRSGEDVMELGGRLGRLESEYDIPAGSTRVLPVVTETPEAVFNMGSYKGCSQRLAALTWGAEDLSAATGSVTNKDNSGNWTYPYQVVRALCLFAASAAGVPAIDTLYADFRDVGGLRASCEAACRDGFSGKIAIHPNQVNTINGAFTPGTDENRRYFSWDPG